VRPILGHVWSGGGPWNVLLLVLGASLVLTGLGLRHLRRAAAAKASGMMVLGIALFSLGVVVDARPAPTDPNPILNIVKPNPLTDVPSDRPVEVVVEVTNLPIAISPSDARGGHLHLYVDDQLQEMLYSTRAEVTLAPGSHQIRVEYVDARHQSLSPPLATGIQVEAV
jgi:hypothetical protein